MALYDVIELIGSSNESWEKAAANEFYRCGEKHRLRCAAGWPPDLRARRQRYFSTPTDSR